MKNIFFRAMICALILIVPAVLAPAAEVSDEAVSATDMSAAGRSASDWLFGSRTRFAFEPAVDLSLAGAALALNLVPLLVDPAPGPGTEPPFDPATVWLFDRALMAPYSSTLDTVSDITQYAAFLAPAVLAAAPVEDWVLIGTMYMEASLLAWGLKETGKALVSRARPYLYAPGYPDDSSARDDWFDSFPSGHTTMSFLGAAFASYTFAVYFPESPWRWPVLAGSYGLALSTAILRVASGSHFASDVLVGALVGSAAGIGVPLLHRVSGAAKADSAVVESRRGPPGSRNLSVAAGLGGVVLTIRLN